MRYANKRAIQFSMLNPKLKHHIVLCGVLNRPQSALWCFDYGCFIRQSEQETVRKHSGHKIYSARDFLKLMSYAKKETWLIQRGSVNFNNDLLRRGLSRTGFRGSDKIRNRAIFGRLRSTERHAVLQHRNSSLWKRVIAWERSRAASGYGIIWGDTGQNKHGGI